MNRIELINSKIKKADEDIKVYKRINFLESAAFWTVIPFGLYSAGIQIKNNDVFASVALGAITIFAAVMFSNERSNNNSEITALKTNKMYLQNMLDIESVRYEQIPRVLSKNPGITY